MMHVAVGGDPQLWLSGRSDLNNARQLIGQSHDCQQAGKKPKGRMALQNVYGLSGRRKRQTSPLLALICRHSTHSVLYRQAETLITDVN